MHSSSKALVPGMIFFTSWGSSRIIIHHRVQYSNGPFFSGRVLAAFFGVRWGFSGSVALLAPFVRECWLLQGISLVLSLLAFVVVMPRLVTLPVFQPLPPAAQANMGR